MADAIKNALSFAAGNLTKPVRELFVCVMIESIGGKGGGSEVCICICESRKKSNARGSRRYGWGC